MRKRKAPISDWASEFLVVAAIYGALFCLGWLVANSQFGSAPVRAPSGHGEQAKGSTDGENFKTGKLLVFNPGHCQIGEFSNIRPEEFKITDAKCDHAVGALVDSVSDDTGRESRIEMIRRYFRGR
jgi:hypothetical protein